MNNKPKPTLTNARIYQVSSNYAVLYDVELVDEEQKIYRGRPVPHPKGKGPMAESVLARFDWLYFLEEYDDRNDWDRLYHSVRFTDELIGAECWAVPKEKHLFGYTPETEGIVLPPIG